MVACMVLEQPGADNQAPLQLPHSADQLSTTTLHSELDKLTFEFVVTFIWGFD